MNDESTSGNEAPISGDSDIMTPPAPTDGQSTSDAALRPSAGIASLCHWSFLMAFVVPFTNLILPLVLLYTLGKDDRFVADNAKEALNLLIASFIVGICCVPLIFLVIGIFMLIALGVCLIVFPIIAAVQTMSSTESTPVYRYPLIFRVIK